MSRRDLIIIAVLVNAGLMTIFFVSALKSDSADEGTFASNSNQTSSFSDVKMATAAAPSDEIDQVLREHSTGAMTAPVATLAPAASSSAPSATSSIMPTSPPLSNSASAPSFADDLKAISMSESAPAVGFSTSAPEVAEKPSRSFTEVHVKKGDVLEKIARQHGVSVDEIMKANQLASTRLKIGQALKIPAKAPKSEKAPSALASAAASKGDASAQYYTVKNGDNPWTIAVKNHIKVEELLKLNGLNEEKARSLKPGDKLRIR